MLSNTPLAFIHEHLEPGESLAEILFGLIMTLTFTLGAGLLVQAGPDAVRELLIATLGANIAWGIIDGAMYIGGNLFERARLTRVGETIRHAATEQAAADIVAEEFEEMLGITAHTDERHAFHLHMARQVRASTPAPHGVTRADLYGALASFCLVFFASIPAALPFLFLDDAWLALRVSNGILICLLFLTGFGWARYTALPPWRTGVALMVAGIALVAISIALGG